MKTRYIKVTGDTAKPLPDRLQDESTHSLVLTDEQYASCVNPTYFKVVDGEPVVKSQEELDEMAAVVQKENDRKAAKAVRDEKLSELAVDVSGVSIQVRPSDELNLRLTLQDLAPEETVEWILSDNTVAIVSKEDLEAAYVLGLTLGKEIYQEYKDVIKAMDITPEA